MRTIKSLLLKSELRILAIQTREKLNLTQREMAEKLEMSESLYSDIETGVSMCGTLTTILLLSQVENASEFLFAVNEKLKKLEKEEVTL